MTESTVLVERTMTTATNGASLPAGLVPTPTREYCEFREGTEEVFREGAAPAQAAALPPTPIPIPLPLPPPGARALIWKQDPSVAEIGIRKVFLPGPIVAGPRDARINTVIQGQPPVSPNVFGDFIQTPGSAAFDAVQTFVVAREALLTCQRARNGAPLPWQWNSTTNTEPLTVFPHGLPDVMNAFYSRSDKALRFGDFIKPQSNPPQRVFTCRSLDIVGPETGHALLDGLKPGWLSAGNPPQTGGLHESFGELMAIFLALAQMDQVEALIAQTKANLHDKNFLSDVAEEFGLALGRPNGLRNADNDLKLSQVGNEVHAISQVFTGGIYDVLADIFAFERKPARKDDAATLYEVGQYLFGLLLRAILAAPATGATFAAVVNQMLTITAADGKPVQYRNFLRNRFTFRQVVVSPTPLTENLEEGLELAPAVEDPEDAVQDRRGCCGTMQLPEFQIADYHGEEDVFEAELDQLRKAMQREFRQTNAAGEPVAPTRGRRHTPQG
jgi:hypothetical protein